MCAATVYGESRAVLFRTCPEYVEKAKDSLSHCRKTILKLNNLKVLRLIIIISSGGLTNYSLLVGLQPIASTGHVTVDCLTQMKFSSALGYHYIIIAGLSASRLHLLGTMDIHVV